ncbi:hypothetical protein ACP4OV_003865 [Aristida adscensionis]
MKWQQFLGIAWLQETLQKDSSAALGKEDDEHESHEEEEEVIGLGLSQGATSSATRANKKAKIVEVEEEGLVGAFKSVGQDLANAIKMVDNELPADLFDTLNSLHGFNSAHISFYYAYLVANPHIGRAFYSLPYEHKLNWVTMFIAEKFPGI